MPALGGGGNGQERNENKILVATGITETNLLAKRICRKLSIPDPPAVKGQPGLTVTDHDILDAPVKLSPSDFVAVFPFHSILSERSSPSRVRFPAPIATPLPAPCRSH